MECDQQEAEESGELLLKGIGIMKVYICDNCGDSVAVAAVSTKGVVGMSGHLALPDSYCEKDFCSPDCYWEWSRKQDPQNAAKAGSMIGAKEERYEASVLYP